MIGSLKFRLNYGKGWLKAMLSTPSPKSRNLYNDVGILNPSIGTSNLGDFIIYQSVHDVLRSIDSEAMFSDYPTQLFASYDALKLMREKDLLFVAGTNLLSSNLEDRYQWKINQGFSRFLSKKVVLLGCGWWQYQGEVNNYTKNIYKNLLNNKVLHSVRDKYTADKLISAGIENVVNTSCPTLWGLTPEKCNEIPTAKAKNVVTTLTFYHINMDLDRRMLEVLSQSYEKVYLWAQGVEDVLYLQEMDHGLENIELVPPTLEAFDNILQKPSMDYIGTRLHAGARALQKKVRTLIVAVDNRAMEIGRDVNLNVIDRNCLDQATNFIRGEYVTDIKLPLDNINRWVDSISRELN